MSLLVAFTINICSYDLRSQATTHYLRFVHLRQVGLGGVVSFALVIAVPYSVMTVRPVVADEEKPAFVRAAGRGELDSCRKRSF
jgi:hypothetical protein